MNGNQRRRVVVTGMGVVSAAGNDIASFWKNLCEARTGIAEVSRTGEQWGAKELHSGRILAAQVKLPSAFNLPEPVSPECLDNFSIFALHAAQQAIEQAGLTGLLRQNAGVILGTAVGGDDARNQATFRVYVKQRPPAPQTIIRAMANAAVSAVTLAYGIQGASHAVSSACASGTHAIAQAYQQIALGVADIMLAGGSEQLPSYSLYRSWRQMRVLSPDGCRPFCNSRNGMVLGEGAGVLVLESLDSAKARGAKILGEVGGFAMNASATDWTVPDITTMASCIAQALQQAGWDKTKIDYINAHGTGTALNDAVEAQAIQRVFGDYTKHIPVSSTKAIHGHALGATGALECIATLLALNQGSIPPNGTGHQIAADCDLNIVHGTALVQESRYALSHSFAFGGLNGVLALARHEDI